MTSPKIIDPAVDTLIRQHARSPDPQQHVQIASPLSNHQLIALMAAHVASFKPKPEQAVALAIELFAQSVVQIGEDSRGLKAAIGRAGPPKA